MTRKSPAWSFFAGLFYLSEMATREQFKGEESKADPPQIHEVARQKQGTGATT
jgi:hypothetical protein